jgi:membrane associated rhomboid family serine protease
MGLYDRHYYRDRTNRPTTSRIGALRMLSVNTWLIVICVGVFVIDGFLPPRLVATNNLYPPSLSQVDPKVLQTTTQLTRNSPPGTDMRISGVWAVVKESSTGRQIGWREVIPMRFLESYLHFSTQLGFLEIQYWRFIGFQFLHANLSHLLFNMLALFFFGPIVEQYLGSKRYLAFYLLCGMCGAIMYLLLNLSGTVTEMMTQQAVQIPGLLFTDTYTPLVGASAGIFGVLMAGAFLVPRAIVLLFFILPMQLRTLAYVLVALALYSVITGGRYCEQQLFQDALLWILPTRLNIPLLL